MTIEAGPSKKSPLDLLADQASVEMTSALFESQKLEKKGVTQNDIRPMALKTIETVIATMRDIVRMEAGVVKEIKESDQGILKELNNNPGVKTMMDQRATHLDAFLEERRARSFNILTKLLTDRNISEETAKSIAEEVSKQELKVIPLPKR